MRVGVRLAVDPGSVRIGVARSDRSGIIATPLTVVRRGKGDLDALASLAAAEEAIEILVGLPRSLSGREGAARIAARHANANRTRIDGQSHTRPHRITGSQQHGNTLPASPLAVPQCVTNSLKGRINLSNSGVRPPAALRDVRLAATAAAERPRGAAD